MINLYTVAWCLKHWLWYQICQGVSPSLATWLPVTLRGQNWDIFTLTASLIIISSILDNQPLVNVWWINELVRCSACLCPYEVNDTPSAVFCSTSEEVFETLKHRTQLIVILNNYRSPFIMYVSKWNLINKTNKQAKYNQRDTEIRNKLTVTRKEGEAG